MNRIISVAFSCPVFLGVNTLLLLLGMGATAWTGVAYLIPLVAVYNIVYCVTSCKDKSCDECPCDECPCDECPLSK